MDEKLIDDILIAFGELVAERRHRNESEQSVEVTVSARGSYNEYQLAWNTGNTLDITFFPNDEQLKSAKIATIYLYGSSFIRFDRSLALMVHGIISGYERTFH